jgi:hypothetical protein
MMRPNFIGWGIAGFFLIGGIAFFITMPEIWIGQIWITVAIFLLGMYVWMGQRADRQSALRRRGTPGTATILEMNQTGIYVNELPQVKLRLRVEPQGKGAYEVTKSMIIPHIALGALGIGKTLKVFVDPNDSKNLFFDFSATGPMTISQDSGAPVTIDDPAAQQAVLKALNDQGIDPSRGSVDLRQMPAARAAVLEALRKHGIDAAHSTAAADPTTPIQVTGTTTDRLAKLKELRSASLITEQEFEQHKQRILEGI